MTSQKQLLFVYGLAINLLIIGVVCYTVFSTATPEKPIRIMYKTAAGKVLFSHNNHSSISGYGISCRDCHHHPFDEINTISCISCHLKKIKNNHYPESCLDCHESEDTKNIKLLSHKDAIHDQCIKCHENIDAGPQKCSECHIF